jgi:hypothetical protein
MYTYIFVLRMTDTMTSQTIELSSCDTLYMYRYTVTTEAKTRRVCHLPVSAEPGDGIHCTTHPSGCHSTFQIPADNLRLSEQSNSLIPNMPLCKRVLTLEKHIIKPLLHPSVRMKEIENR